MPRVFVSVGSSLNRYRSIAAGVATIAKEFGDLAISPVFESESVGFAGPPFLNLAIAFETSLEVVSLIERLKQIEDMHGRDRTLGKHAAKTLDLDLLTYGQHHGLLNGIVLPRPEIAEYAFVLWPMAELAPNDICPGMEKTYLQLWQDAQSDQDKGLYPVDFTLASGVEIKASAVKYRSGPRLHSAG